MNRPGLPPGNRLPPPRWVRRTGGEGTHCAGRASRSGDRQTRRFCAATAPAKNAVRLDHRWAAKGLSARKGCAASSDGRLWMVLHVLPGRAGTRYRQNRGFLLKKRPSSCRYGICQIRRTFSLGIVCAAARKIHRNVLVREVQLWKNLKI